MNSYVPQHFWAEQTMQDAQEFAEWHDALLAVMANSGKPKREGCSICLSLALPALLGWRPRLSTSYVNSVSFELQPAFPRDLATEECMASIIRWNALRSGSG